MSRWSLALSSASSVLSWWRSELAECDALNLMFLLVGEPSVSPWWYVHKLRPVCACVDRWGIFEHTHACRACRVTSPLSEIACANTPYWSMSVYTSLIHTHSSHRQMARTHLGGYYQSTSKGIVQLSTCKHFL